MLVTRKTKRSVPLNSGMDAKNDGSLYTNFYYKNPSKMLRFTSVFRKFR